MASSTNCPRCGTYLELQACSNCGNTAYHTSALSDGSYGLACNACSMGFSHVPCPNCGAMVAATTFHTGMSRMAERMQQGMQAHQGGSCFVATALYGAGSYEVRELRRFRDQRLLRSSLGRFGVRVYYAVGPHLARASNSSGLFRRVCRTVVSAVVRAIRARR